MSYDNVHYVSCHTESWQSMGRRAYQEDRFLITPLLDGHLCLVMDGHGGWWAAEEVLLHFLKDFMHEYHKLKTKLSPDDMRMLSPTHERMLLRRTIAKQVKRCRNISAGTTLSLAYGKPILRQGDEKPVVRVHVATMGDSPVAVWNGSRLLQLPLHSALHHQKDISKVREIIKEGKRRLVARRSMEKLWAYKRASIQDGYVWRQRGGDNQVGVAMTRAIGDADMDGLLIRRADIRTFDIPISGMVLLATDGILEDDSPTAVRQRAKQIMDKSRLEDIHLDMIGKSLGLTDDNTTMVMMRWSGV